MSKADRAKKRASLPKLAPTPKPKKRGKARMAEIATEPDRHDPRKTALEARCRLAGVVATKDTLNAATAPHMGAQLGLALERICTADEIKSAWMTWQGFCAAERTYRIRYIGQSGDAKGAAIAMVPDKMQTDQSHSVDLRDSEQRDRDAKSNWRRWRGYLSHLSARERQLIIHAERDGRALWENAGPTQRGRDTVAALMRLVDVLEAR